MTSRPARLTEGSVSRHVIAMASTSALGLLAVFLVDILTLLYVSRLHDQTLLAAIGLAKTLVFINGAFASGIVIAAGVVLSERIGRHAGRAMAPLVTHQLILGTGVAATVALVELLLAAPVSQWLGVDAQAWEAARHFVWMALPASVLLAGMQMCAQMLKAQGHVRLGLWVPLSGAATLAVADPLFIFGLGLGLDGAAIAYALSAAVSLLVGLTLVRRQIGLALSVDCKLLRVHSRHTLGIAVPAMLANLAMPVGITCLVVVMAGQGASALAGMAVVDRVLQFAYCAFFALPGALVPVLAQNIGAGLDARARSAIVAGRKLVIVHGVAVWLLLLVFGPSIADAFELQGPGRAMFMALCHFGAALWILFGLDFLAQAVFLSIHRAWWVPAFGWLRGTLGSVPFVFAGAHWAGGSGALIGMWCGNALVALAAITVASLQARRFFSARATAVPSQPFP